MPQLLDLQPRWMGAYAVEPDAEFAGGETLHRQAGFAAGLCDDCTVRTEVCGTRP